MRKTLIGLVAAIALIVAACGGDTLSENVAEKILENELGGDVDIDVGGEGDDVEINIETDEGSFSIGGGDIPDELTVPVPGGGDVMSSIVSNGDVAITVSWPLAEYDALVDFYDDWVAQQPTDFDKTTSTFENVDDETVKSTSWYASETDTAITIVNCPAAADGTRLACLTIVESE